MYSDIANFKYLVFTGAARDNMADEFKEAVHPALIRERLKGFADLPIDQRRELRKYAIFADKAHGNQLRKSGEPYMIHPFAVAKTLHDIGMDCPTMAAGLLHDVLEDTEYTPEDIRKLDPKHGDEIVKLVDGVTKIRNVDVTSKSEQEAQTIRKMFFAMVDDPRVIIIKLADKLHNMSTLQYLDPKRAREIAFECLDIFAPLADRLGINTLKIKLEDQAFKVIKPEDYAVIRDYISAQSAAQQSFFSQVESIIKENLKKNDINGVQISSRVKHLYSIYQKMRRRGRKVSQIQDIYGMRIICKNEIKCYTILGLIHKLWTPVEGHFKDYIAMPKANNYQSLHTTVIIDDVPLPISCEPDEVGKGPSTAAADDAAKSNEVRSEKRVVQLEIQIRTYAMDNTANYGMAAHWAYKAESGREKSMGVLKDADDKNKFLKLVARMQNWKDEIQDNDNFMEDITSNLLKDTIVVFTPRGKAIELPLGSTALDFAYAIHSDIGNKCQMAKANGNIIALSEPLKNTDIVEIITAQNAAPRESWLKYAFTQSARRKIKSYLNKHDSNVVFAKNLIVKNLDKPGQKANELKKEALARPDEPVKTVVNAPKSTNSLSVGQDKNTMISFAKCCHPVKGDPIIGYVSRGRGIIVHREDCPNIPNMTEISDRMISVSWDDDRPYNIYKFKIVSKRIGDIFGEVESAIKKYNGNLLEGRLDDDDGVMLCGTFRLEVPAAVSAKKIIKLISSIPSVAAINLI